MPVFVAYLKVEDIDGVASVAPASLAAGGGARFTIDVKNGMSDETRTGITIAPEDEVDIAGSRGVANLVLKFADARESSSCSVLAPADFAARFKKKKATLKEQPRSLTADDAGAWVPFLAFEARGMDIVNLSLGEDDAVVTSRVPPAPSPFARCSHARVPLGRAAPPSTPTSGTATGPTTTRGSPRPRPLDSESAADDTPPRAGGLPRVTHGHRDEGRAGIVQNAKPPPANNNREMSRNVLLLEQASTVVLPA